MIATTKKQRERHSVSAFNDRLSPEDNQLYIKLNQNLLVFATQKLNPKSKIKNREDFLKLPIEEKVKIRENLTERIGLIDEFVDSNPCNFTQSELNIIKSWKNIVKGTFYIINYTKNGAVFLEDREQNPKAYLVLALETPLCEIIPVPTPARVKAVLLPFKERIIYDGLLTADRIIFGSHMARELRTIYDRSVMEHGLVESLPYKKRVNYSDEDKLTFYLSTKERREENWEEIEKLLENKNLLPLYLREMGKANSRSLKKQLRDVGVKRGWFAIAKDVVVASAKTREELENTVEHVIPNHGKELIYVFELK